MLLSFEGICCVFLILRVDYLGHLLSDFFRDEKTNILYRCATPAMILYRGSVSRLNFNKGINFLIRKQIPGVKGVLFFYFVC